MSTLIQLRRDLAANWTTANPVLGQGEMALETDTGNAKMGNGTTAWNSLPYWTPGGSSSAPSLALAPSGATAETFNRGYAGAVTYPGLTSGTLYVRAIQIPAGVTVSNLTFMVGGTAEAGGSHGWYALLDSSMTVRAVTADQTAAAKWGATFTTYTLPVASAYETTYSGLYYVGVCVVASTMPAFVAGPGGLSPLTTLAPDLMGSSSTGLSTPPSTGTAMASISGSAAFDFYAYTS